MNFCETCGVELDKNMVTCPICKASTKINRMGDTKKESLDYYNLVTYYKRKGFAWKIISIILFSGILSSIIIDFGMNAKITWSEYPASIALCIFFYVSLFAFWQRNTTLKIIVGLTASSSALLIIDYLIDQSVWALKLGIPLLLAVNLVLIPLLIAIQCARNKGINLIAYTFFAIAVLCLEVEGIFSFYNSQTVELKWSVIVAGCIFPIIAALLFAHFYFKKGRDLERTFHV